MSMSDQTPPKKPRLHSDSDRSQVGPWALGAIRVLQKDTDNLLAVCGDLIARVGKLEKCEGSNFHIFSQGYPSVPIPSEFSMNDLYEQKQLLISSMEVNRGLERQVDEIHAMISSCDARISDLQSRCDSWSCNLSSETVQLSSNTRVEARETVKKDLVVLGFGEEAWKDMVMKVGNLERSSEVLHQAQVRMARELRAQPGSVSFNKKSNEDVSSKDSGDVNSKDSGEEADGRSSCTNPSQRHFNELDLAISLVEDKVDKMWDESVGTSRTVAELGNRLAKIEKDMTTDLDKKLLEWEKKTGNVRLDVESPLLALTGFVESQINRAFEVIDMFDKGLEHLHHTFDKRVEDIVNRVFEAEKESIVKLMSSQTAEVARVQKKVTLPIREHEVQSAVRVVTMPRMASRTPAQIRTALAGNGLREHEIDEVFRRSGR